MKYDGVLLVAGGCPSCETSAKHVLRRMGKLYPRDYGVKYIQEMKGDPVFKKAPELGQFTSAFLYNPSAGVFINLKNINLTQEVRDNVEKLFSL